MLLDGAHRVVGVVEPIIVIIITFKLFYFKRFTVKDSRGLSQLARIETISATQLSSGLRDHIVMIALCRAD